MAQSRNRGIGHRHTGINARRVVEGLGTSLKAWTSSILLICF